MPAVKRSAAGSAPLPAASRFAPPVPRVTGAAGRSDVETSLDMKAGRGLTLLRPADTESFQGDLRCLRPQR